MIATFDRLRYPLSYLSVERTEAQVQADILRALAQLGIAADSFDAGGKAMRARAGGGGRGAGSAGLPDIIGALKGGRGLFIEVKKPAYITQCFQTGRLRQFKRAGEPTKAQLEYIAKMQRQGAAAGFAWSVSDALEIAGVKS
jgi:Holliday junction resolvase